MKYIFHFIDGREVSYDDYATDKLIYGAVALLGSNLIHHYAPIE